MAANTSNQPLTSFAVNPVTLPPFIPANRAPLTTDIQNAGSRWQDNSVTPPVIYVTTGGGVWVVEVAGTGDIDFITGNSGSVVTPTAGNVNIVGNGTSVNTSGSGSTLTISVSNFQAWVTGNGGGTLANNTGYFITSGTPSWALPATAAIGTVISIVLSGGTSWTITQAAGQSIQVGQFTSTVGVSGSVASSEQGDTINLVCIAANTKWMTISFVGNLLVT